jgi:hypothetical protein
MALNAILVANHEAYRKADFLKIAAEMRRIAPEVRSYVAWKDELSVTALAVQLLRPTLSIELCRSTRFRRLRGALATSPRLRKPENYRILEAAGLPLPRWTLVAPDTRLDPGSWGGWVVLKPATGFRGRGVVIARTEEVRYRPPESYPLDHPGREGPMIAQRYIHTGPWPSHYRVTTCFGRPLYCIRYEMMHHLQPPLSGPDGFGDGQARQVVTSPQTSDPLGFSADGALAFDADVLALGRRVHAAFGDVPMIGTDILRDAADGRLHVAEANLSSVWNLSGQRGEAWAARGLRAYEQFGAIRVAAEAMVEAARRLAC